MIYHVILLFLKALSYLPLRLMYVLSNGAFYLFYYLVRYRRKIVRKNLTESFPEKRLSEIIEIEKDFYRFFVDVFFETCKMTSISPSEMSLRMRFKNTEAVENVLKQGKSISLYMGHYGNWEWVSSLPLHLEKQVVAGQIYQKLRNKNMERLMKQNRERMGAVCIEMHKTARSINELVAENKVSIIGFIADQSPARQDIGYYLRFLNHQIPVLTGSEKITKHYGFEAWFLDVKRVKRGYYEAEFVQIHENPQSQPDFEITERYYRLLEQMIRRQPELYLWSHKRFKHAKEMES